MLSYQNSTAADINNKKRFSIILLALLLLSFSASIYAQDKDSTNSFSKDFSNSINMCPVALAFNFYSMNFEHLFDGTHGLVARFDYESISDTYSDNPIELSGYGFILNYRYHFSGQMESIFLGSYARYRIYDGNGKAGATDFDMSITESSFGLNLGKRWVWNSGFNVLFSMGYGFFSYRQESNT